LNPTPSGAVPTALRINISVLLDVTPCSLVEVYLYFRESSSSEM